MQHSHRFLLLFYLCKVMICDLSQISSLQFRCSAEFVAFIAGFFFHDPYPSWENETLLIGSLMILCCTLLKNACCFYIKLEI